MVDYFNTHLYAFWFTAGFILLAIELLVLGFATGFVLFLGVAALVTGGLLWVDVIPQSWLSSIATFAISAVVISAGLWKPFKNLERKGKPSGKDNSSDFIGHQFRLTDNISLTSPGTTRYSGIEWHVEIDAASAVREINAGTLVTVTSVDAGKFWVKPVE